jgi:hypothetical protein
MRIKEYLDTKPTQHASNAGASPTTPALAPHHTNAEDAATHTTNETTPATTAR